MSLFQYPLSRISASRCHHSLYFGLVMSAFPTAASMMSFALLRFWSPNTENSQPPNHPSCSPPPMGVTPIFFSAAHAFMNCAHVFGGLLGFSPALRKSALL